MHDSIRLAQGMWFDEKDIEISFPDDWRVEVCDSPADTMEPMSKAAMEKAFAEPIGASRIQELAKGKQDVVIIFDDISRGTRLYELVPFVLKELKVAGVTDDRIRFICSLGNHGAHTRVDFVKKLGKAVVAKYPVFNHNPYENCDNLGKTSRNTEVSVNSEIMKCDLKIGMGSIVPHPFNGFGGGGKILFPGVSSAETVLGNHLLSATDLFGKGLNPVDGLGRFDGNIMRLEMEEVCAMAGLDLVVDALVNSRCETIDLFVGHPIEAHYAGVEIAKKLNGTRLIPNADVAVVNANFKACEAAIALLFGSKSLKPKGDIVVVSHTPMGQITHYLIGSFGKYIGGKLWSPDRTSMTDDIGNIIIYSPYPSRADEDWFGGYGRVSWADNWEAVMDLLENNNGSGTHVNVFTDATIQYFPDE
ncbi:MAG: DUF2088 domain-containing protein [Deltaproteobacteria bacterium]|nr:DUF2088 domain-containing protein [Deltaproteobacteria bacterium]